YTVTFNGHLIGFNQPMMIASVPGVTIAKVQDGAGGTFVNDGASLSLQGNLTIAGEPLIIQGQGDAASLDIGAVPEVQTLTVSGSGNFTLNFNGSSDTFNAGSGTLAKDIQDALNDPTFATIGGLGGVVTVTRGSGSTLNVFTVTFGGTLRGVNQALLTV